MPKRAASQQPRPAKRRRLNAPPIEGGRLYGKYRGVVTNNFDLEFRGRILAWVPHLFGSLTNWALPCAPYAGPGVGFWAIPPIGASVWIEFEGGDPSHPIWSGGFWQLGEFPAPLAFNPAAPQLVKMLKTEFATVAVNDTPATGGVTVQVITPAVAVPVTMTFNSVGAEITCGSSRITMTPQSVQTASVDVDTTAGATASVNAGASIGLKAGADISLQGAAKVAIEAGADASVSAGGSAGVQAGGDVSLQATGAADVVAGGAASLKATGAVQVVGNASTAVTSLGAVDVSGTAVSISAPSITFSPA